MGSLILNRRGETAAPSGIAGSADSLNPDAVNGRMPVPSRTDLSRAGSAFRGNRTEASTDAPGASIPAPAARAGNNAHSLWTVCGSERAVVRTVRNAEVETSVFLSRGM